MSRRHTAPSLVRPLSLPVLALAIAAARMAARAGSARVQDRKPQEAEQVLRTALATLPTIADFWNHLAIALTAQRFGPGRRHAMPPESSPVPGQLARA